MIEKKDAYWSGQIEIQRKVAEAWIATHAEKRQAGEQAVFAMMLQADRTIVGTIGLTINAAYQRAELGYWIGVPHWNQGYATGARHTRAR